ncbi:MAG: MarR family winged helix-turn-helix transcriptional regulator [Georgenia sp.]
MVDEATERVQAAFAALMWWLSRSGVRRRFWAGKDIALSPTDAWLLEALHERGPMRVSSLAAWQGVDKSTVTPQVRRLERAGRVDRTPDPDDGRASLLRLSARGAAVREHARASGAALLEEHLAMFDDAERRTFADLLSRFAAGLDAGR